MARSLCLVEDHASDLNVVVAGEAIVQVYRGVVVLALRLPVVFPHRRGPSCLPRKGAVNVLDDRSPRVVVLDSFVYFDEGEPFDLSGSRSRIREASNVALRACSDGCVAMVLVIAANSLRLVHVHEGTSLDPGPLFTGSDNSSSHVVVHCAEFLKFICVTSNHRVEYLRNTWYSICYLDLVDLNSCVDVIECCNVLHLHCSDEVCRNSILLVLVNHEVFVNRIDVRVSCCIYILAHVSSREVSFDSKTEATIGVRHIVLEKANGKVVRAVGGTERWTMRIFMQVEPETEEVASCCMVALPSVVWVCLPECCWVLICC